MNENYKRKAELQAELNRWFELLKSQYQPQKIIIFGSFANGTVGECSDNASSSKSWGRFVRKESFF